MGDFVEFVFREIQTNLIINNKEWVFDMLNKDEFMGHYEVFVSYFLVHFDKVRKWIINKMVFNVKYRKILSKILL